MSTSYSIYSFAKPTKRELSKIKYFQRGIPFIFMLQKESRLLDVLDFFEAQIMRLLIS